MAPVAAGDSAFLLGEDRSVFIVAPGGLRDSAGIGRLVTCVTRTWHEQGGPPFRIIDPYGAGHLAWSPFLMAGALLRLLFHAWRRRIALVHVHMATRGSVLRKTVIARFVQWLGLPVVLHLHGNQFDAFYRRLPGFVRRLVCGTMRRADAVLVLGQYWRGVVADEIEVDPRSLHVLYNAVAGPVTAPLRSQQGACRILFLGRLEAAKGTPELIDALADDRLASLEWSARIAGSGDVDRYRERVAATGLSHRIDVHEWAPESQVQRWLAEADVFVLPSHREGMSMAVLEAMAFGLAVIATPVGANAEAVVDGVSGILVPVGSPIDLAAALQRVITDHVLRRNLQDGARRRFEDRFDVAVHSHELQKLYAEVGRHR